jgi:hypothetical protein
VEPESVEPEPDAVPVSPCATTLVLAAAFVEVW